MPSEPATFAQRLPNVFQMSMAFGTRWVVVAQTSLVGIMLLCRKKEGLCQEKEIRQEKEVVSRHAGFVIRRRL